MRTTLPAILMIAAATVPATRTAADQIEDAMRILEVLHTTQCTAEFDDRPLPLVIDELSPQLPAPLRVDYESLIRLGIDRRDRVTLHLPPTTAAGALASLCLVLGDEFERPRLEVFGGQIVITTVEGTASMRVLDVYDVRDLLADAALTQRLRESSPVPAAAPIGGAPSPNSELDQEEEIDGDDPAILPVPGPDGEPVQMPVRGGSAPDPAVELLGLIMDHVDPEAWFETGGTRGKMSERDGLVLVTAAPTTHWRLRDALRRLRAANPASLTLEASIVELPATGFSRLSRRHPPSSASLVDAIRREKETATLWRATLIVTVGERAEIETTRGDVRIRLMVGSAFEPAAGVLRLEIEAHSEHGADHRSVRTTASLTGSGAAALVELPSATPGQLGRYLVIVPRR